ncbi:DUF5719 family protein [Microbacterium sp.]|uniref:DUF5719 family protein n=1 Tax=Microbacterium sp. TaxID=51671 RepID=UPI003C70AC26
MKQRTLRLAATGARLVTGTVVAAACVLGVIAAAAAPWPGVRDEPATTTIQPVPRDAVLVCNGAFRALGRDATQAGQMVSASAMNARTDGAMEDVDTADLVMPDVLGGTGAVSLTGRVKDREVPLFSASESVLLSDADASGFAAAPCREPGLESWLVGGDVSVGASDIILLSNPGAVTANVELTVYGDKPSASTVVVPAGTQMGVPLASVAAGSRMPVVHVVSSGAPVRATLQSTLVRTLDAVGIDLQDGVSGPQNAQSILGVQSSPAAQGDDSTTGIQVRMLAPGADAKATVRITAAGSDSVIDEYPIDLAAGKPAEVALSGLRQGAYDIEVSADEPVVAGARQVVRAGDGQDLAWSLPSPELEENATTMFSVPSGAPATLYLHNPGDAKLSVEVGGDASQTVHLGPGASATLALSAGGYTLTPTGRVNAAVGMLGGGGSAAVASWPLWPGAATTQPIVVRP